VSRRTLLTALVATHDLGPFVHKMVGWPMGLEPITFGATIRCSSCVRSTVERAVVAQLVAYRFSTNMIERGGSSGSGVQ
jgi:hypothetical protein